MAESDGIDPAHLTEPRPVNCIFLEGTVIEAGDGFIRIVGWVRLETVETERPEKRIVARAVLTTHAARALVRDLRKSLARGGH